MQNPHLFHPSIKVDFNNLKIHYSSKNNLINQINAYHYDLSFWRIVIPISFSFSFYLCVSFSTEILISPFIFHLLVNLFPSSFLEFFEFPANRRHYFPVVSF